MEELIARLGAAAAGGREFDLTIAREALGLRLIATIRGVQVHNPTQPKGASWDLKPYTTSLDAALTLLPQWASAELMLSAAGPPHFTHATLWDWRRSPTMSDPGNEWKSEGNRPLAINVCIAALKARARAAE